VAEGFSIGQLAALVMDGLPSGGQSSPMSVVEKSSWSGCRSTPPVGLRSPTSLHHSLSALRPASVICIIVTRTARRLGYAGSRTAVASPSRTSSCSIPIAKPCANISDSVRPRTEAANIPRAARWSTASFMLGSIPPEVLKTVAAGPSLQRVNYCNHQKLQASPGTLRHRRTGPGGCRLTAPRLPLPLRMAEVAIRLD
jgi:hypothetical protein